MKGSIQEKIGTDGKPTYYAVVAVKGKRKWFRGGPTKKDAQRVLNEKLTELHRGTFREPSNITFEAFGVKWLRTYAEHHVKPNTYDRYNDIITRLLNPVFGAFKVREITTGMIQEYITDRLDEVSKKTVINEYAVISIMFKSAVSWENLYLNPVIDIKRPPLKKHKVDIKEILNPNEIGLFLSKAEAPYRVAFMTDIQTGLRAGELWGLQWGDIDWNSRKIHVQRTYSKGIFGPPKTEQSDRMVDISKSLMLELKKWKLACPKNEHDSVFPSVEGNLTCHDNVIKRFFDAALRQAGLRHVSFHSLRHSNASIRIQAGQNIKYIQSQMGHASIQMTMDVYGHLFEDKEFDQQQVNLMDGFLNSVRKPLENDPENAQGAMV